METERPGRPPTVGGVRIAVRLSRAVVSLLSLAVLVASGYGWFAYRTLGSSITHVAGLPAGDGAAADPAENILLVGDDHRPANATPRVLAQLSTGEDGGSTNTDTMIVLHIPADHKKAYLISMPRDLYVHIPKSRTTQYGNTNAKLNASFSWGGTPLTVQTIEEYTNVRMDHVLLIDFGGFKQVIDALGGIDMNIEKDITSIHPPKRQFKKGMNHLNGDEALDYARQRYQFVDGDFARMRHQQEMMKAILDKAVSGGTVSNPSKLNSFLKAVTKSMTVDKDFSLADMALQFRNLRSDDLTFMVSPNDGSKKINGEDVVVPDKEKATALYDAVRNDKMTDWMTANGPKPSTAPSTKTK
jgi:LCP family protein required for cell wall assembly